MFGHVLRMPRDTPAQQAIDYYMGGQPPARGLDPAHEGLASGPPPCSSITLQSGLRNPSQKNAGFMNDMMRRILKPNILASVANRVANYGDR